MSSSKFDRFIRHREDFLKDRTFMAIEAVNAHRWLDSLGVPVILESEPCLLSLVSRIEKLLEMQKRKSK